MLNISERGIKKFFKKNPRGWITFERQNCVPLPNYFPSVAIEEILKQDFPDYYSEYKKYFFSDSSTFYTDAKSFDGYCEFLFDVLFRLRHKVGDLDAAPFFKRYCALIGENLTTPYIEFHHSPCKFVGMLIDGTPLYRALRYVAHKLRLNHKAKYYVFITNFLRKITKSKPPTSSYSQTK